MAVRVRLLGGFDVDGRKDSDVGSRKGRTVLKLLAVADGAVVSVDLIAHQLWGDDLPASPSDQVGVLVSRLRRVFGSHRIARSGAGYLLEADWVDVRELRKLAAAAADAQAAGRFGVAGAAARQALELCRGPLLPDEDGEWIERERSAINAIVSQVRRVAVDAAVSSGDHSSAASMAEQALAWDPYDEVVLRSLMNAHLVAGRPASALAAYARTRRRIAEDLGVPPTAETEALHGLALVAADGDATEAYALTPGPQP